jgi:septal ring factor EnvC (AmiA/AmiB activator)
LRPTFWVTSAAILVAAALIASFIGNKSRSDALAKTKAEIAALEARIARLKAEREKAEREREEKEGKPPGFAERIHRKLEEAFASPTPSPY